MARPTTIKPDLTVLWGETGETEEPDSEKIGLGWIQEVPTYQMMNWVLNRQDKLIAQVNDWGIMFWDANTTYGRGAWVRGSDKEIYVNTSTSSKGEDPITSSNWESLIGNIVVEAHTHTSEFARLPTTDQKAALDAATTASGSNAFATINDIPTVQSPVLARGVVNFGDINGAPIGSLSFIEAPTNVTSVTKVNYGQDSELTVTFSTPLATNRYFIIQEWSSNPNNTRSYLDNDGLYPAVVFDKTTAAFKLSLRELTSVQDLYFEFVVLDLTKL